MSMYDCHSSNKGQAPRRSSYKVRVIKWVGFPKMLTVKTVLRDIHTDWQTEIKALDGTVANCGHIRSSEDGNCKGCVECRNG